MSNNYYDNQNASAPGVVLAHAAVGELVGGRVGIAQGGDIQPAGLNSMAPYRGKPTKAEEIAAKPVTRAVKRERKKKTPAPHCKEEGCRAYAATGKGYIYCMGHLWAKGIVERPEKKAPDGDTG
jgi:hypothetical protein